MFFIFQMNKKCVGVCGGGAVKGPKRWIWFFSGQWEGVCKDVILKEGEHGGKTEVCQITQELD